jgi:hypothetical protein
MLGRTVTAWQMVVNTTFERQCRDPDGSPMDLTGLDDQVDPE